VSVGVELLSYTPTNLIDPDDDTVDLTPENIQQRILGSKLVIVVEQMQILTIWTVKACLLFMFGRLTLVLLISTNHSPYTRTDPAYMTTG
jgi:hypothetical protein